MRLCITTNHAHASQSLYKISKIKKTSELKPLEEDFGFEIVAIYDTDYDITNLAQYQFFKNWYKIDRQKLLDYMYLKVANLEKKLALIKNWNRPELFSLIKNLGGNPELFGLKNEPLNGRLVKCNSGFMWDELAKICYEEDPDGYKNSLSHFNPLFDLSLCLSLYTNSPTKAKKKFMSSFIVCPYDLAVRGYYCTHDGNWASKDLAELGAIYHPLWELKYAVFVVSIVHNSNPEFLYEKEGKLFFNKSAKPEVLLPRFHSSIDSLLSELNSKSYLGSSTGNSAIENTGCVVANVITNIGYENTIIGDGDKLVFSNAENNKLIFSNTDANVGKTILEDTIKENEALLSFSLSAPVLATDNLKKSRSPTPSNTSVTRSAKGSANNTPNSSPSSSRNNRRLSKGKEGILPGAMRRSNNQVPTRKDTLRCLPVKNEKNISLTKFINHIIVGSYHALDNPIKAESLFAIYNKEDYFIEMSLDHFITHLRFSGVIETQNKIDGVLTLTLRSLEDIKCSVKQ